MNKEKTFKEEQEEKQEVAYSNCCDEPIECQKCSQCGEYT